MEMETCVPPGFRFHPTEEELVGYYLQRKINSQKFDLDVIADIDLYKMEPWDIQANCKAGYEEQKEWYFFSHKDKKYPTGTRTNRATAAGFWKATGRDKAVVSKNRLIGMRKTLVFYRGRAPNGSKSDWIMHEYRLQTSQHALTQEEGWVVCRAFKKPSPNQAQAFDHSWQHHSYHLKDHAHSLTSPPFSDSMIANRPPNELQFSTSSPSLLFDHQHDLLIPNNGTLENQFIDLPNLDSPTISNINDEDLWKRNSSIDWKDLDNLIVGQSVETESLSRRPRSASMSQNCEIQSPLHHMIFGNFPNL